jgi:hypothetical protein
MSVLNRDTWIFSFHPHNDLVIYGDIDGGAEDEHTTLESRKIKA